MKYYFGSENNITIIPKGLVTNNLLVALFMSIRMKHIPLYMTLINNDVFIVENSKNNFHLLKVSSYIYEFEQDKLPHTDWFYDSNSEFTLVEPTKYQKSYKIKNVYYTLKKLGCHFITYSKIQKFINNFIPKKIYQHSMKYMYHGSPISITDKYVKPMHDGFEKNPYVYANCIRTPSLKFSVKGLANTLKWGYLTEH